MISAPDLLLLDYLLPGINGVELYDQLHATKGIATIPAIILIANVTEHVLEKRSNR